VVEMNMLSLIHILSDGPQSIYPAQFVTMMDEIEKIAPVVARHLPRGIHIAAAV